MNENLTEFLWVRLQLLFASLVEYVCSSRGDFIHNIGKSSNSAFPLRAYLTFMKDKNGDEIAVTVDIVNRDGKYFVEADICGVDGLIVAEGPSTQIAGLSEKSLILWLEEYEAFLKSNKNVVKEKAADLE